MEKLFQMLVRAIYPGLLALFIFAYSMVNIPDNDGGEVMELITGTLFFVCMIACLVGVVGTLVTTFRKKK
ncbi:MAG: hypothetical protein IJ012_05080 [Clostridia bacterium]|nr:hypothetical protein [Clostridia bacterium]